MAGEGAIVGTEARISETTYTVSVQATLLGMIPSWGKTNKARS